MSKYEDSLDEDVSDSELLELSQKRSSPESFQTEKKVGKKRQIGMNLRVQLWTHSDLPESVLVREVSTNPLASRIFFLT